MGFQIFVVASHLVIKWRHGLCCCCVALQVLTIRALSVLVTLGKVLSPDPLGRSCWATGRFHRTGIGSILQPQMSTSTSQSIVDPAGFTERLHPSMIASKSCVL